MKTPSDKLAQMLERSRMSRGELGRRVKSKALRWNQPHISPDATRVRCWLEGDTPRAPVPDILADVFSDHFGFRITTYDLGLGDGGSADAALVYTLRTRLRWRWSQTWGELTWTDESSLQPRRLRPWLV